MSGVGAFIVGAAVGAAAVATHNKNKHRHNHNHTEVHRTVYVNQPTPNQIVYVNPAPPPPPPQPHPASKSKPKGQKHHGHPPSIPPPPPQRTVVTTTYYHDSPAPGPGAPIGFSSQPPVPQATYYPSQPPPYSPHPPSQAPPFTHPGTPVPAPYPPPVPASYPPQSPGYPHAQPFQPPGYPPVVQSPGYSPAVQPFQTPGCYPPTPFQSTGYPPYPESPHMGGYPPANQPYPGYPPSPVGSSQSGQRVLQAQVNVQLSSASGAASVTHVINNNTTNDSYRRCFFIVNSETRCALQVNPSPGSKLIIRPKQATGSNDATGCQLWYLDNSGVIRCRSGDYAIEARDGGVWLCVAPYSASPQQQWVLTDGRILANRMNAGECIGLEEGLMGTPVNADVIVSRYQGRPNHHWVIEYV